MVPFPWHPWTIFIETLIFYGDAGRGHDEYGGRVYITVPLIIQKDQAMNKQEVTNRSRLGLAVGALVLAGLMSTLFGWVCDRTFGHDVWTQFVLAHFELVIGMPMAAVLAFAIVAAFQQTSEGPVSMRLGPLEFSGPAGPILLWVICFLASVFAIELLSS